jgi:hypothetical protein
VSAEILDPISLWELDRLAEMEYALSTLPHKGVRKPRRSSPAQMVRMWDEDNESDTVVPKRPVRQDRRQEVDLPFIGNERRQSNGRH